MTANSNTLYVIETCILLYDMHLTELNIWDMMKQNTVMYVYY